MSTLTLFQICTVTHAIEALRAAAMGTTGQVTLPINSQVKILLPTNKGDTIVLVAVQQCSDPLLVGAVLELNSADGLK